MAKSRRGIAFSQAISCSRKRAFFSRQAALALQRSVARMGKEDAEATIAYRCGRCHFWHLGTPSEQVEELQGRELRATSGRREGYENA